MIFHIGSTSIEIDSMEFCNWFYPRPYSYGTNCSNGNIFLKENNVL